MFQNFEGEWLTILRERGKREEDRGNSIDQKRFFSLLSPCSLTPFFILLLCSGLLQAPAIALPPPEDLPEEVLRTEIILEGRSRLNGEPLTAAEYAELEAYLKEGQPVTQLSPKLRELIFLLRLRKAIYTLIPFLN